MAALAGVAGWGGRCGGRGGRCGGRRRVALWQEDYRVPIEIARDIVRRAYWMESDTVCDTFCTGWHSWNPDCCHVIGYEDVYPK